MSRTKKYITFIFISILFGSGYYFTYYITHVIKGTIIEIRENAIVVQGEGPKDPAFVLPFEEKTKFFDVNNNQIVLSKLRPGYRVKIKMFPRSYGGIFLVRDQKTVQWVRILLNN